MAATSKVPSKGLGLVLVEFEYEYKDQNGVLVTIKPNERYVLLAKTNDHWWHVRNDSSSKAFYIPAKYVKELPTDFPSLLDFADKPGPDPVPHPVVAPVPVPVPVPVPKSLEEPGGSKTKQNDEVTIRLRPDTSNRHHRNENRMSTFGVPLDLPDLAHVSPRVRTNHSAGAAETGTTASTGTTNMADSKKQPHVKGHHEDQQDSGKPRVPSFSPADPRTSSRHQNQPIHVEMPVVPPHSKTSEGRHDNKQQKEEPEEEEEVPEEATTSESSEEEEECRGHHIYESIQDLNLDLEALSLQKAPSAAPESSLPAAAPPSSKEQSSLSPSSPIYANVCSLKKTSTPQISISTPTSVDPDQSEGGHALLSPSSSSNMISPASPLSPQDEWQVFTDQESGRRFFYHPLTRQTTWSDHRGQTLAGDMDLSSPLSPASSQGSCEWEELLDETSGRVYYHNHKTGTTSWALPDPTSPLSPAGSTGSRNQDDVQPPLPKPDYPVDGHNNNGDSVFTQLPQIPRAQLDGQQKQQEQRLMGNGVPAEGGASQVRIMRHSIAEDMFSPGHRRISSDLTDASRKHSPDSPQFHSRLKLRRNLSNNSTGKPQRHGHLLEKAGIVNKTKLVDHGKKMRKNWTQSWTVLHGGILTFHKDPKFSPAGNTNKASQIVPEYTVDLKGASVQWAAKDKSSKKFVLELKTRQGCEYLIQYDTESIISDWHKVIQEAIQQLTPHQLEPEHLSEDEDDSDREDKKRGSTRSNSGADSEQSRIRSKLRRFLQRRPTLQSVKEKGYIRDNVFGCHLDVLCHRENSIVPKFVEKCIKTVERRGLDVDGIYRVSGNLAVIQRLRHKADHEEHLDLEDGQWEEIHVITGALKLFFRELPEPLFPFCCFDKFIAAIQLSDYSQRVSYTKDLVRSLPLPNYETMKLLFKHLRRVIDHKDSNRMSVQSVAIVFGPTLLRPQIESANMTVHMVFQSQIVELMLNKFNEIFTET
ncbi:PREDICTED: rho GTPase-activating protein 12-like isoform X1 [Poecilia mexicana]|uniref:Rho GTPase activating protein 27, like n=1 Tax=Poecilia mexicana TaxID=48701 RepID=A0A3B3Z602_9TELE|nr:PREDICTED: rho GTPase-activating protein 12-like isoform X1 [Poecilia mexicana]XP_014846569.1 PREDICTED: rho GTPase-activating protein 12-like isoform X1 [Poecilia mexicana]